MVSPGLTSAEARERLAAEGPNALPSAERHGLWQLIVAVLREPMFLLLIGAAAIYMLLGDLREALVLAASILLIIGITVVQERRTERALEALRDLTSPRALVVRDGKEIRIAGGEVVRGDLLCLREGDRIAADARLVETHALEVDESLLTGESLAVAKQPGEQAKANVFSGTLVVRGTGLGEVVATGPRSELGRIGAMLRGLGPERTALEIETAHMVRIFAGFGLALCAVLALLFIALRGEPLQGILAGLTLAMAMLPEEFPVVLTVFLALGAMRIARHGVLTRRLPAVEMLGAATVLCCDKTGTLTENRMAVAEGSGSAARVAAMACEAQPFDPMERAILAAALSRGPGSIEHRYPMTEGFLAVCHGIRLPDGTAIAAMKGAPEAVLDLCPMEPGRRAAHLAAAADAAARGLRVLGVARAEHRQAAWPDSPRELPFAFVGMIALADPLRPAVPAAIALCRRAGIRVIMITGDHPATARAIAAQAGIDASGTLTGDEIAALDDQGLAAATTRCQVFARVRPEQKLRLVNALRDAGEVVAMTGDGVNDAPALKAAHIGIAMGKRGTDVAREAASLVLLEDDFTSIVATIRLGRRIYDNIRNAMRFLVAVHVPLAGMAVLPLLAGWPLFIFPLHVVFLEFVIDPACSIVFETEHSDPDTMERPPRPRAQRLFTPQSLALGVLLGLGVFGAVAGIAAWSLASGMSEGAARAMAFTTLVVGDLALIVANRSPHLTLLELLMRPNRALWWIAAGTITALLLATQAPAIAVMFRFDAIGLPQMATAAGAAIASVLWYDIFKLLRRRAARSP